jgi:hypothetical protein
MLQRTQVCRHEPLTKDKFQLKLSEAWSRIASKLGSKMTMAARMGDSDDAAVKRGVSGSNLPEAHKIFNSLLADPSALDEILAEYGVRLVPIHSSAANDLHTAVGILDGASELIRSQDDGHRCHVETLKVADKFRPHLPAIHAIIQEADAIRSRA